ncbi:hypothetical protein EOA85_04475 [Mesorhizobium sp. M5C.F.Ca.IN.020.29.1.1]|uniref:hypothetical protein n=1 Tax=unclassified Mesorhizobium TaxID=325217 RepID=UPI000FCAA2B9|nr:MULTISPECIES: hypothetical protein [unclassified Mesorhizobium]RUV62994.1 hypothetical protein EOA85_04475 [Mesorhizobium sp. M5C.F.Ca.IN.020.29.1.1]TIM86890.1 MAG: hypothetical protein E5Y50_14055 [Mesorhizobium sp.]
MGAWHHAINPRAFKQAMRAVAGSVAILASEHDEIGFCGITATAVLVSPHAAHYSTQSYAEVRNKVFADVASSCAVASRYIRSTEYDCSRQQLAQPGFGLSRRSTM